MAMMPGVMRRKLAAGVLASAEGGPGADRAWRLSLARAARDAAHLSLEVARLVQETRSLTELLELPPDRALLTMLDGPGGGLGLLVIAAPVLSGIIEMQTIGRVSANPAADRRPTRTDAAMVAGLIDGALERLELALAEEADLVWAGGFRYASFLEDARPLGLLLEDGSYRVLRAEVTLALGAKTGEVMLALPAEGKGRRPPVRRIEEPVQAGPVFSAALAEQVMGSDAVMQAMIARLTLPLSAVMALQVGDVLALPQAGLDQITLEGLDGRRLATGKLGQTRGLRAVRLAGDVALAEPAAPLGMTGTG